MPNDGSLDVLPLSPCTSGSLGLDAHFLGTVPLKVVENRSTSSLNHSTASLKGEREKAEEKDKVEERKEDEDDEEEEEEKEEKKRAPVQEEAVVAVKEERVQEGNKEKEHEDEDDKKETIITTHDNAVHELVDKTMDLDLNRTPAAADTIVSASTTTTVSAPVEEKMASGIPQRPVKTGMPTYAATKGLSPASLALKKKQAAENAAAATKAMAVEIPETDSISNRIKMFGGGAGGARPGAGAGGLKRFNVRDIVQKFKDVDDKSQEEITHVNKGHSDPKGVCSAYSLSTASRPTNALRPTPRRKMSHELGENEARAIVGGNARFEEDRMGVSQESVQSVRNAKSLFENLGRAEGGGGGPQL